MKAYLKGRYGYKNFGDELLLLGVIQRIFMNYKLQELIIESGDVLRLQTWLDSNYSILLDNEILNKINIVSIKQHQNKQTTHIKNILGQGNYKKYFKFFGGGEVLNEERKFPHDGRNLFILYKHSIRNKNFVLLGGLGPCNKFTTKILFKYILPKAQKIIVREKTTFKIVDKILQDNGHNTDNLQLYNDFSLPVLQTAQKIFKGESSHSGQGNTSSNKGYVLININSYIFNESSLCKIKAFVETYSQYQKIYLPCDMGNDVVYYKKLKEFIPDISYYDWTTNSLLDTLRLFYNAKAGIGARLHFLYPLKVFNIPLQALVYKEKVQKLILQD